MFIHTDTMYDEVLWVNIDRFSILISLVFMDFVFYNLTETAAEIIWQKVFGNSMMGENLFARACKTNQVFLAFLSKNDVLPKQIYI